MPHFYQAVRAGAGAVLGLALFSAAWAQTASVKPVAYAPPGQHRGIGEVTLVVGPAVRTSVGGMPETIERGTRILPGDRIDTAQGGMAHIRFIDGALVSLRPGSRLWVEDYQYDPSQVAKSLVRFRLDHGVARAISGAAAEGAKERFRLNTPLVAIGVRGTDFVVRTSQDSTTAAVNQGAIVMAPFDAGCLAQALGPCTSPGAMLLSADMGHQVIEFKAQLAQPEVRPMRALASARNPELADSPGAATEMASASGVVDRNASTADDAVGAALVKDVARAAAAEPAPPTAPPVVVVPEVVVPPVVVPPIVVPTGPAQLKWGRWGGPQGTSDIAVAFAEAASGRKVTVADEEYVLFRIANPSGTVPTDLGAYQFSLQQSQAQFVGSNRAVSAATVQNGQLGIDFASRRFATSLSITSLPTGLVNLSASGFMRDDGIFVDNTSVVGQSVAGAAAFDGKSAAYLFEKAAAGGTLSGITLWSRP